MPRIFNILSLTTLKRIGLTGMSLVVAVTGTVGALMYSSSTSVSATSACQRVQRPLSQDIVAGIKKNKNAYVAVSNTTKVPWELLASIHYRETAFGRVNPWNGQGIFQFVNKEGGPYPYTGKEVSETEFRRQLTFMANRIQNDYVKRSDLNYTKRKLTQNEPEAFRVKDVLFSYNGRAGVYKNQAQTYGYSKTSAPYEGSPYVMNMFDCPRASMGIITRDYGGIDGKDTRYGAFTLYARLKGGNDSYWKSLQRDKVDRAKFERLVGDSPSVLQSASSSLGEYTKTVSLGDKLYIFHYSETAQSISVTHWDGKQWRSQALDGSTTAIAEGSATANVGKGIDAFVYYGEIQVFYYDETNKSLKHAWSSNNGEKWKTETMEGTAGSLSGYTGDVGKNIKGFLYGKDSIQLYYYDENTESIRHGWWDIYKKRWGFENFDGVTNSLGGSDAKLGELAIDGIVWNNDSIQMFYYDSTNQAVRHAWWDPKAKRWGFENFDGITNSLGGRNSNAGKAISVVEYNKGLQVFYFDSKTGELMHSWWDTKKRKWGFERFDGDRDTVIGNYINSGQKIEAVTYQSGLYVFYYDDPTILNDTTRSGGWRLAYWSNGAWQGRMLDGGYGNISGSTAGASGNLTATTFSNGKQLQIFYQDSTGGLKHSWITQ